MYSKHIIGFVITLALISANAHAELYINEVELNPPGAESGEWIEIYNSDDTKVDISGYILSDSEGTEDIIPNGTEIEPNGFFVFTEDIETISLDNTDETIMLMKPNGELVDITPRISDGLNDEHTHQRTPDGGEEWMFIKETMGAPNPRTSYSEPAEPALPEFPGMALAIITLFSGVAITGRAQISN